MRRMDRPGREVLQALARLDGNPDFDRVIGWLQDSRQRQVNAAIQERDEAELRQTQGAAQALDELIEHTQGARESLKRGQR
ncbi:hypothetical protein [Halorhodospira halophila]|uniref:hypothetical protein n=1 Tax=Halorhodospira halophila TaxID=1053 RepID=UPI001912BAA7|nr:hypothetical protein [Halorhodospira halophila]